MIDELVEILCNESEEIGICLSIEDRKGSINLKDKQMTINPHYWNERAETFAHEMLHYHYNNVEYLSLGQSEEFIVESNMQTLLKNKDNKDYILNYLDNRL